MFRNYLLIAIRNLYRNKLYSFINIGGLAVGLAVCMTILLYVQHEHSYDRFNKDRDRMFILGGTQKFGGQEMTPMTMNHVVAPMVKDQSPEVESFMRIYGFYGRADLSIPSNPAIQFREKRNFLFADSNFFSFFSFHLLRGDASTVLSQPNNIVITQSAARKYFGDRDPIGQSILYQRKILLKVTGVCTDPPSNSTISFSFIAPFSLIRQTSDSWVLTMNWFGSGNFFTLLKLTDPNTNQKIASIAHKLAVADHEGLSKDMKFKLLLLTNNHLSDAQFGWGSSNRFLGLFTLIAILILALALINYMSLATAKAITRAREVGVRKAIGAARKSIAGQFYVESALSATVAFVIGALLFVTLRHLFFDMIGLRIDASFLTNPFILLYFFGLLILTIVIAGSYPALLLSAYKPVAVLYGRLSNRRSGSSVRRILTVLQFSISISLVICSLFIGRQLTYLREADTGIDRNNVVMINCEKTLKQYQSFKNEVAAMPAVKGTATGNYDFFEGVPATSLKMKPLGREVAMGMLIVDTNFIPLMGFQWKEKPTSMRAVMDGRHPILNEIAVQEIGLTGKATGQNIFDSYVVGGVLKDFNYVSLDRKIEPLELYVGLDTPAFGIQNNVLFVRFWPHSNVSEALQKINRSYTGFDKIEPFNFEFLDDAYTSLYKNEDRLARLMGVFTTITVIIACLGLFGLATFSAQQRIKEIGIRKVLGASIRNILTTLSVNFLQPVAISLLVAIPVSAWVMHNWLNNYAYRISLSWRVFAEASVLMSMLAMATVFFLSLKAARSNPTDSLRAD